MSRTRFPATALASTLLLFGMLSSCSRSSGVLEEFSQVALVGSMLNDLSIANTRPFLRRGEWAGLWEVSGRGENKALIPASRQEYPQRVVLASGDGLELVLEYLVPYYRISGYPSKSPNEISDLFGVVGSLVVRRGGGVVYSWDLSDHWDDLIERVGHKVVAKRQHFFKRLGLDPPSLRGSGAFRVCDFEIEGRLAIWECFVLDDGLLQLSSMGARLIDLESMSL